jgi:DNA replication protein DnaC
MGIKTAFAEVMSLYRLNRERAERDADDRKQAVYGHVPRIREIDTRLSAIGVSLAVHTLVGDTVKLNEARAEMEALNAEKAGLLTGHKIPDGYMDISYKCPMCKDTGFIEREGRFSERCQCLKQKLIEKYYDLSNLKSTIRDENFDTFVLDYYSTAVNEDEGMSPSENMQMIYKTAMKFVNDFGREFQNLFLYGAVGLGKTFMCNCIAKDILDKGYTVIYMTAPRMFKVIEDYRFRRADMEDSGEMIEMIETASEVDLLIIDDLGAEFDTMVTSVALFDIINQRLISKKPTVISTNLDYIKDMNDRYSDRVISRVWGNFRMLKFFGVKDDNGGDDIRVKKKYRRTVI